jgi:putative ABC transport system permease protein
MVGRLKPGVTIAQAQDDAERVAQQVMQGFPADSRNFHIRAVVYSLQAITVMDARPMLRMLFLAVAVVLLIACANFAGLLLVRAIQRQRETAVRLAIGAPAMTLARQMILESLALSVSGGVLGIGLAAAAIEVGKNFLPETMPLMSSIALDWRVAGFALGLAAVTGFFCGLAPGFAALRTNVNAAMKEGGRSGSAGGSHARLRSALVVLEIAVALVLLTASGLLLRSYRLMNAVNLGFRPDHVATAVWGLPLQEYGTQAKVDAFNRKLLEQLRQQPGAEAVGLTTVLPMAGGPLEAFVPEGFVDPRGPDRTVACPYQVDGDALEALGIPLLRGRYFTESDNADGQLVVIVNHELAEHYWPHQDPIGKRLRVGTLKSGTPWQTVVGEVADAKQDTPDADAREQFYEPVAQLRKDAGPTALPTDLYGNAIFLVMRSKLPAKQMEGEIRSVVRGIDPQLALTLLRTMDEVVAQSEAPRRFNTIVISSFALAAVLLAVLGIYSVVAFSVASRVQEMAIRMALGSQRSDILRLILISGLKLALMGCVLGLGGAMAASRVMRAFLFGVSPFDPIVLILAAVVVFALALAASALPARRAASVDPLQALRGE